MYICVCIIHTQIHLVHSKSLLTEAHDVHHQLPQRCDDDEGIKPVPHPQPQNEAPKPSFGRLIPLLINFQVGNWANNRPTWMVLGTGVVKALQRNGFKIFVDYGKGYWPPTKYLALQVKRACSQGKEFFSNLANRVFCSVRQLVPLIGEAPVRRSKWFLSKKSPTTQLVIWGHD